MTTKPKTPAPTAEDVAATFADHPLAGSTDPARQIELARQIEQAQAAAGVGDNPGMSAGHGFSE